MRSRLSSGLFLAAAGLLSGCYSAEPALYAPGTRYSLSPYARPQYVPPQYPVPVYPPSRYPEPEYPSPQYDDPREPEPYDSRAPEPFPPAMLEPSVPSPSSALDNDAPVPERPYGQQSDPPQSLAPARPSTRTGARAGSVPLMGFRPMRGQQGL